MKKITIVAVGRLKEKFFAAAAAEYIKRLSRFCSLQIIQLCDFADDSVKRESSLILEAAGDKFWLLDIGGESYSSEGFSRLIDKEFFSGDTLTFVIGGSSGVDERVRQKAKKRISFGEFTYPHQLMRVMLLEQIYRAMTISEGLPYHK